LLAGHRSDLAAGDGRTHRPADATTRQPLDRTPTEDRTMKHPRDPELALVAAAMIRRLDPAQRAQALDALATPADSRHLLELLAEALGPA
jgi:hypothetical protein